MNVLESLTFSSKSKKKPGLNEYETNLLNEYKAGAITMICANNALVGLKKDGFRLDVYDNGSIVIMSEDGTQHTYYGTGYLYNAIVSASDTLRKDTYTGQQMMANLFGQGVKQSDEVVGYQPSIFRKFWDWLRCSSTELYWVKYLYSLDWGSVQFLDKEGKIKAKLPYAMKYEHYSGNGFVIAADTSESDNYIITLRINGKQLKFKNFHFGSVSTMEYCEDDNTVLSKITNCRRIVHFIYQQCKIAQGSAIMPTLKGNV